MLKVLCDKCGKDCGAQALDVLVRVIDNPAPLSIDSTYEPQITCDNSAIRMLLCHECYEKLGMPNVFTTKRTGQLAFRDKETMEDNI